MVLHCCSRSPGSDVGKNTAAGRPAPLPEKSNRKPTADRRACHPGTPPTWARGEGTRGREWRRHWGWHLKTKRHREQHTDLVLYALLGRVHGVTLTALNTLQRLLNLHRERDTHQTLSSCLVFNERLQMNRLLHLIVKTWSLQAKWAITISCTALCVVMVISVKWATSQSLVTFHSPDWVKRL